MPYRHDFVTTSAFASFTVSFVAGFAAVGALAVDAHIAAVGALAVDAHIAAVGALAADAPIAAVTAASIAVAAFVFLSFVAWAAR